MGEQGNEGRTEREADDPEGRLRSGRECALDQWVDDPVHDEHAQQAKRHDQESRDRAATKRDGERLTQAATSCRRCANVRLDGDIHPGITGDARQKCAKQKRGSGDHCARRLMIFFRDTHDDADDHRDDD